MRSIAVTIALILLVAPTSRGAPATTQAADREARTEFVRFVPDGRGGGTLQVAVATYQDARGVRVDLVSAVHVGERSYYDELARRLRGYDAVLYELITNALDDYHEGRATTAQDWIARGLDLEFQDVNVNRPNFVHADLTHEQVRQLSERRDAEFGTAFANGLRQGITLTWSQRMQQNAAGIDVMAAMMSPAHERARRLRRAFAIILMLNERPLPGRYFTAGGEVLIGERGFTLESIEWVTAWTVGPDPKPTTWPAAQSSR